MSITAWKIFQNSHLPHDSIDYLPEPPPWRQFLDGSLEEIKLQVVDQTFSERDQERAQTFQADEQTKDMVNVALHLRRPLLVTGKPGSGKSSLIFAVAYELKLGKVLKWSITSRSTLQNALYQYDAIGRLQDTKLQEGKAPDISQYLRLGPLGTALLPSKRPRALLIDEIDKSDIDLPNDLLNIFEEGEYEIPELSRLGTGPFGIRMFDSDLPYPIYRGHVRCTEFPFVVLTSNGEREFPPAFLRRCLQLEIQEPSEEKLAQIVAAHLKAEKASQAAELIGQFINLRNSGTVSTDQLLNVVFLVVGNDQINPAKQKELTDILLKSLSS